jgi:integrase/recombinase XerC
VNIAAVLWVVWQPVKALEEWRALVPADQLRILPYTTTRARQRLKALAEKAGVPYLGTHALRHTAGARLYKATKNLEDVACHLGHSGLETARVYAKWDDQHLRTVVDDW